MFRRRYKHVHVLNSNWFHSLLPEHVLPHSYVLLQMFFPQQILSYNPVTRKHYYWIPGLCHWRKNQYSTNKSIPRSVPIEQTAISYPVGCVLLFVCLHAWLILYKFPRALKYTVSNTICDRQRLADTLCSFTLIQSNL